MCLCCNLVNKLIKEIKIIRFNILISIKKKFEISVLIVLLIFWKCGNLFLVYFIDIFKKIVIKNMIDECLIEK